MKRGVITTNKATGDVYFLNMRGEAVLPVSKNVEVIIKENFYGDTLRDALDAAQQFACGAIKLKVEQKLRGHDCVLVVRNIRVRYDIRQGFCNKEKFERLLNFYEGDCILRKGEQGSEFFVVKEGIVDIAGMEYRPGSIFGRAAFNDGIRKMDVYAKTDVTLVAIDRKHPDLKTKIPVLLDKFAEETRKIKKIRPGAKIDTVVFI